MLVGKFSVQSSAVKNRRVFAALSVIEFTNFTKVRANTHNFPPLAIFGQKHFTLLFKVCDFDNEFGRCSRNNTVIFTAQFVVAESDHSTIDNVSENWHVRRKNNIHSVQQSAKLTDPRVSIALLLSPQRLVPGIQFQTWKPV